MDLLIQHGRRENVRFYYFEPSTKEYARKHSQEEDDVGCDWLMGREAAANKSASIPYKRRRNVNIGVAL